MWSFFKTRKEYLQTFLWLKLVVSLVLSWFLGSHEFPNEFASKEIVSLSLGIKSKELDRALSLENKKTSQRE